MASICPFYSFAASIDLDFSNQVESNNTTDIYGLGPAYTGNTMTFLNVASHDGTTVDAKVNASAFGLYTFQYHIPNYNTGDIGFILNGTGHGSGGLSYVFQLYDGTGSNSGSFNTPLAAEELSIMVHDVDGSGHQSENLRAYSADGLISYQTGTNENSLVASTEGNSVLFTGPRQNFLESDSTGAVILNYANTSQFTLNFESETFYGSLPNPVFSAIDGDLSMGTGGFAPSESVSDAGSTAALLGVGVVALAFARRRLG